MSRAFTKQDTTSGGGLLPAGVKQYNVFGARIEFNEKAGIRELIVEVANSEGSGNFTVPLEKPANMQEDTFYWLMGMNLTGFGVDVVDKTPEQVLQSLPAHLGKIHNGIVELEVTHTQSTKLKDDGTPFVNHRVKVRRMVEEGTGPAPAAAPDAGVAAVANTFAAAPAGGVADDDLPF